MRATVSRRPTGPSVVWTTALLAAALTLTLSGPTPAAVPTAESHPESDGVPRLIVDPTAWWMSAGNGTNLSAAWVNPSPGCELSPIWYRWSVVSNTSDGWLNSTAGSTVSFRAASAGGGTTTVRVESAGQEQCGPLASARLGLAEANLTVVAPLVLASLSAAPNPVAVGNPSSLLGSISGGLPPYLLRIAWGDGSTSNFTASTPGDFHIPHEYPAGEFEPAVTVTDALGLVAQSSVEEPLTSSDSLAVGVESAASAVDVDVPIAFTANVLDEPNGSSTGWACSTPNLATPWAGSDSTNFSCAFSEVGPGTVLFEVFPPVPTPTASATFDLAVEPRPAVVPISTNQSAEVGQPCTMGFNVGGGVPPFRLSWTEVGAPISGSLSMGTDGTVLVPFVPEEPGTLQVIARLTDADGVASANATVGLVVSPPLNVTLIASRSTGVSNVTVDLVGSVVSGAAPFSWTVVPGVAPLALAVDGGVLGTVGSFEWQGVYATETNATGEVIVVDADGAFASSSYSVSTFARLQLVAYLQSAGPTGPGGFALRLDISGGVPPFQVNVTTAALGAWNFTDPRDGWATWTLAVDSGGVLLVRVAVTDALDYRQNWTGETEVASPPPANPTIADTSSTTGSWVVVLVGLATSAVVGAGLAARRAHRRSRPASKPAIDPVEVLRGIIEPAEGADRSTVELLADEAGVPLEAAHVTIDRLIAEGTLCSEKSPEGGEILAWSLDS